MFMLLLSIDPALGRLDYDSLSDQALMEMLIDGMNKDAKANFQDSSGNFLDVCDWEDFKCAGDRVEKIYFYNKKFAAPQIPFEFIPSHVRKVTIFFCELSGTLDASALPQRLQKFLVALNKLHGTIDFCALPRGLKALSLRNNAFHGSCPLSALPDTLTSLDVAENQFSGEIAFNDMPAAMEVIELSLNNFSGSIKIDRLPKGMRLLLLCSNAFSGDLFLGEIPSSLEKIDVEENKAITKAVIAAPVNGPQPFPIYHNSIERVVDGNGNKHPWSDDFN